MLMATDGSWDPLANCGGWAVVLSRKVHVSSGSAPRLGGVDEKAGGTPRWVRSAHGCEAWALLTALRWCRKLRRRPEGIVVDCEALYAILEGNPVAGVRGEDAHETRQLVRQLGIGLLAIPGRDELAAVRQSLHHRAHRSALRAMRRRRAAAASDDAS